MMEDEKVDGDGRLPRFFDPLTHGEWTRLNMFTKNEDVGSIKISFYGASDGVSLLAFRDEARFYRNETFCRIMYL